MTRVTFTDAISCEAGSFSPGQTVDLEDRIAAPWLKSGLVTKVAEAPVAEATPAPTAPAVVTAPVRPTKSTKSKKS